MSDPRLNPNRACRGRDTDLFFPSPSDHTAIHNAVAICRRCPILASCAAHTLATGETDGVWAATFLHGEASARRRAACRDQLAHTAETGIRPPLPPVPAATRDAHAYRLRGRGLTYPQVARALGCSLSAARRAIARAAATTDADDERAVS